MEIVIDKNKAYEYAMALTAHTGKSIGQYESVAIAKDNYPLLDTYMSSAITSVEAVLRRHLDDSNSFDIKSDEDSYKITLKDKIRPNEGSQNMIESCIRLSVAMYIAGSWLISTPAKENGKVYLDESRNQALIALSAYLNRSFIILKDADYSDGSTDGVSMMTNDSGNADYSDGSTDDVSMMTNDSGNADYSDGSTDDVNISPCWKHVRVQVCDDHCEDLNFD